MAIVTGTAAAGAFGIKALLAKLGALGAKAGAAKAGAAGAAKMAGGKGFKAALGKILRRGFYPDPKQPAMNQLVGRLAPDVFFGGLSAFQTPGDLGDKLIAGTTSAVGGALGGGLTTGLTGGRLGQLGDFAGGVGGDYLSFGVGEELMRLKDRLGGGVGQTPYEKMNAQQQELFAEQIRQETLQGLGLIPGVRDEYMGLY